VIGLDIDVLRRDPSHLIVSPKADRISQHLVPPQCLANTAPQRLLDQLAVL
jgi:hypothetical protein